MTHTPARWAWWPPFTGDCDDPTRACVTTISPEWSLILSVVVLVATCALWTFIWLKYRQREVIG